MEALSTWNITVEAFHAASEAYSFCNQQLNKANLTLPEFDHVVSAVASTMGFVLTHSPSAVRQLYSFITSLPLLEYNFATILFILILFYTAYCLLMSAFRWVRGLVFGFARFSLLIFVIYGLVYAFQCFLDNTPTNSTKTSTHARKI